MIEEEEEEASPGPAVGAAAVPFAVVRTALLVDARKRGVARGKLARRSRMGPIGRL